MNFEAIRAIYTFEMARFFRTLAQSFISPVLSTSLYFVVFGTAIGSRIDSVEGVSYGAFIVPGLIMLSVMTQAISNASFGIYFPKFIGTIYELLSAPVNFIEIVIGYVGAAATKSLFIGMVILATSFLFVDITIAHPFAMLAFLVLTCLSFALMGFIIGIWAGNFEQLNLVPLLVVTPLVFLGGSFYSITCCRRSGSRCPCLTQCFTWCPDSGGRFMAWQMFRSRQVSQPSRSSPRFVWPLCGGCSEPGTG